MLIFTQKHRAIYNFIGVFMIRSLFEILESQSKTIEKKQAPTPITQSSINTKNKKGKTALHKAIIHGNEEMVKHLTSDLAIEINALNDDGDSGLHLAVTKDHLTIVSTLLDKKASPAVVNKMGETPLHLAATKKTNDFTKLLADSTIINKLNHLGETALHKAVEAGQHANVLSLLDKKANTSLVTNKVLLSLKYSSTGLNTVLHYAFQQNKINIAIIDALIHAQTPVHVSNQDGFVAAHLAVGHQQANLLTEAHLDYLLKVDASLKTNNNATILHHAAKNNQLSAKLFEKVLNNDFKKNTASVLDAIDNFGNTALLYAAESDNLDKLRLLVDKKANVNIYKKTSALHLAIKNNNADAAILLLEHGANTEALDQDTNKPLVYAANNGNVDIINALHKKGADFSGPQGELALKNALLNNHIEAATRLIELGANANIHIVPSIRVEHSSSGFGPSSSISGTRYIKNDGDDKTGLIQKNDTPLHIAVKMGNIQLASACLIQKPMLVNALNDKGISPPFYALKRLNHEMAHLLYTLGEKIQQSIACSGVNLLDSGAPRKRTLLMQAASRGLGSQKELDEFFTNPEFKLSDKQKQIKEMTDGRAASEIGIGYSKMTLMADAKSSYKKDTTTETTYNNVLDF